MHRRGLQVVAGSLALFATLLALVATRAGAVLGADAWCVRGLHGPAERHQLWVDLMNAISHAGTMPVYLLLLLVLGVPLVRRGAWRAAVLAPVILLSSSMLNGQVKVLVGRERPALDPPVATADGLSFPSGHAQSAVVAGSLLALIVATWLAPAHRRRAAVLAGAFAAAVGFSRVALGVHYPSDVLAGYALGAAWVSSGWLLLCHWQSRCATR